MKMHWRFLLIPIIVFCLISISLNSCTNNSIKIELTDGQLSAALDKYFPLFLPGMDYVTVLDKPEVNLDGNKMQLRTRLISPTALTAQAPVDVSLAASLFYNPDDLTFYSGDWQLTDVKPATPDEAKKQRLIDVINPLLATTLKQIPVYTLDQKNFKDKLTAYFLNNVEVVKDKLILTLALPGR